MLEKYLAEEGLSQTEFAAKSGVPQCQLSLYLRGLRRPGLKNAVAISKHSKGRVPVDSWDALEVRKVVRRKRRKRSHAA